MRKARGLRLDHLQRGILLAAHDHWHMALNDPGFFTRDPAQRVAKILLMVHIDRRDHAKRRLIDHIGGVEPPTKTHLKQRVISRCLGKGQKARGGRDLEIGDGIRAIGGKAAVEHIRQHILVDQLTCQPDTLMKAGQMRAGIGMGDMPRPL